MVLVLLQESREFTIAILLTAKSEKQHLLAIASVENVAALGDNTVIFLGPTRTCDEFFCHTNKNREENRVC